MSMYGVNAGVPKTLVRYLVQYEAEAAATVALHDVLLDILATPVSPELLPAKDGEIAQITEDLVGPYELHDFYLYYVLRCGFGPAKIYRLAKAAFAGRAEYTDAVLYTGGCPAMPVLPFGWQSWSSSSPGSSKP